VAGFSFRFHRAGFPIEGFEVWGLEFRVCGLGLG